MFETITERQTLKDFLTVVCRGWVDFFLAGCSGLAGPAFARLRRGEPAFAPPRLFVCSQSFLVNFSNLTKARAGLNLVLMPGLIVLFRRTSHQGFARKPGRQKELTMRQKPVSTLHHEKLSLRSFDALDSGRRVAGRSRQLGPGHQYYGKYI
jgi:hypothetical protein